MLKNAARDPNVRQALFSRVDELNRMVLQNPSALKGIGARLGQEFAQQTGQNGQDFLRHLEASSIPLLPLVVLTSLSPQVASSTKLRRRSIVRVAILNFL